MVVVFSSVSSNLLRKKKLVNVRSLYAKWRAKRNAKEMSKLALHFYVWYACESAHIKRQLIQVIRQPTQNLLCTHAPTTTFQINWSKLIWFSQPQCLYSDFYCCVCWHLGSLLHSITWILMMRSFCSFLIFQRLNAIFVLQFPTITYFRRFYSFAVLWICVHRIKTWIFQLSVHRRNKAAKLQVACTPWNARFPTYQMCIDYWNDESFLEIIFYSTYRSFWI